MIRQCYRLCRIILMRFRSKLSQIYGQIKWHLFKIPFKTNDKWGLWTDEIAVVKSYLKPNDIMLEWGAGVSSLVLADSIKEYYSIEHDRQWYEVMRKRMRKIRNLKLFHVSQNLPWNWTTPDGVFSDGSYKQFKDYVDFPAQLGRRFDVALIDGRARVACAKALIPLLNRNATVFLHDFERPEYHEVLKYYELKCRYRTLAVLTLKVS